MEALQQARELSGQILEMTASLVLTGAKEFEEAEVEAYLLLLDEREPLVDELTDLKNQLGSSELSSAEFEEIKKIISEITEIDKKHIKIMEHMRNGVQESYKEVKQGQRIHAGYNPLPGNEVSSTINVKH